MEPYASTNAMMIDTGWRLVATVHDTLSAHVLTERLAAEGIPTRIKADPVVLGAARRCRIMVPEDLAEHARRLLAKSQFTDDELDALAVISAVDGEST